MSPSLDDVRTTLHRAMSDGDAGLPAANRLCLASVDLLGVDGVAISLVRAGATQGTFGCSSEVSRRLDEYQFTFGEGPSLDAVASGREVLAPDLASPRERRWPAFSEAVRGDGIRAVFAVPIMVASACVVALDLFRAAPGGLRGPHLARARVAGELAAASLAGLAATAGTGPGDDTDDAGEDGAGGAGPAGDIDRVEVHQATGILISALDVRADEALLRLRGHAVATGRTASEVAWDIIERRLVLDRDPPAAPATEGGGSR